MLQIDFVGGGGVFSKPCLLPFIVKIANNQSVYHVNVTKACKIFSLTLDG